MTPYEAYCKANKMTPYEAYCKAYDAGKRLPELENIILDRAWSSLWYAKNILKDRWIEAEDVIMTNPCLSYEYAKGIIKGRLPDKMHNMMFLHAIKNPGDSFVKGYFEFIK